MNRRDVVLQVLREHQATGRPAMHESVLLNLVHHAGDQTCTPQALRMTLRGLGDAVRCPVHGPIGMARWEAAKA